MTGRPAPPDSYVVLVGAGGGGGGGGGWATGATGPTGPCGNGSAAPSSYQGSFRGVTGPPAPGLDPIWRKLELHLLSNEELLDGLRVSFGPEHEKIRTEVIRRLESFPLPAEVIARKIHED